MRPRSARAAAVAGSAGSMTKTRPLSCLALACRIAMSMRNGGGGVSAEMMASVPAWRSSRRSISTIATRVTRGPDAGPATVVPGARRVVTGGVRLFGPRHLHRVVNTDAVPAVSVHVYAPSLTEMTEYTRHGSLLHSTGSQLAGVNW